MFTRILFATVLCVLGVSAQAQLACDPNDGFCQTPAPALPAPVLPQSTLPDFEMDPAEILAARLTQICGPTNGIMLAPVVADLLKSRLGSGTEALQDNDVIEALQTLAGGLNVVLGSKSYPEMVMGLLSLFATETQPFIYKKIRKNPRLAMILAVALTTLNQVIPDPCQSGSCQTQSRPDLQPIGERIAQVCTLAARAAMVKGMLDGVLGITSNQAGGVSGTPNTGSLSQSLPNMAFDLFGKLLQRSTPRSR